MASAFTGSGETAPGRAAGWCTQRRLGHTESVCRTGFQEATCPWSPKPALISRAGPPDRLPQIVRAMNALHCTKGTRSFVLRSSPGRGSRERVWNESTLRSVRHATKRQRAGRRSVGGHRQLGATSMTSLPKFLPSSRPMKASLAFSRPNTMSSRVLTLPSRTHSPIAPANSLHRGP